MSLLHDVYTFLVQSSVVPACICAVASVQRQLIRTKHAMFCKNKDGMYFDVFLVKVQRDLRKIDQFVTSVA